MNFKQTINKLYHIYLSYKETFDIYRDHETYISLLQSTKDCKQGRVVPYEFRG